MRNFAPPQEEGLRSSARRDASGAERESAPGCGVWAPLGKVIAVGAEAEGRYSMLGFYYSQDKKIQNY